MISKFLKTSIFVAAGIAVGIAFAKFNVKDYRHASVSIKKGEVTKPIYISDYSGRQVLALSLKNLQRSQDIEIRADGAEIESWYPPVVRMPFTKWMEVEEGRFRGISFGKRLPLYLTINGKDGCKRRGGLYHNHQCL